MSQKCYEDVAHSKILLCDPDGGNSKIVFINQGREQIRKVTVDGCAIKDGKRCDYLIIDHNTVEYFVELKGKQIKYACQQISRTIKKMSTDPKGSEKYSFVISTACPLTTTEIQHLKKRFKKDFNSSLRIKNNYYECVLS